MSADPSLPRSASSRQHRLTHDIDAWVASASADGAPYLVPLSFDSDGEALLMATPTDSPTGRNLAATRAVGLGRGHTRDGSMIDGEVEVLEALRQERRDRFVARTGFDPRALATPYPWVRISPRRIQAWRRSTGRSEGEPDVLFEAGQIEPGEADGDREGGPASQMETR